MVRMKCSKCGVVFEKSSSRAMFEGIHFGPYYRLKCPACGRRSWFNVTSSVKDPITWPPEQAEAKPEQPLTEEEQLKKRLEESKYEKIEE